MSLPPAKRKQHLLLLIEDSETVEFRVQSMAKSMTDIGLTDKAEALGKELNTQRGVTASLQKQLAELKD